MIRPSCAACSLNYAFLDSLEAINAGAVVGLALEGSDSALNAYAGAHGITFPLVSTPSGRLLNVIPRHSVPLTVVIARDSLRSVLVGELGSDERQALLRLVNGLEPHADAWPALN